MSAVCTSVKSNLKSFYQGFVKPIHKMECIIDFAETFKEEFVSGELSEELIDTLKNMDSRSIVNVFSKRNTGKTTALLIYAVYKMTQEPNTNVVLYINNNMGFYMSRVSEIIRKVDKRLRDDLNVNDAKLVKIRTGCVELPNGSKLLIANRIDRIRGYRIDYFLADDVDQLPYHACMELRSVSTYTKYSKHCTFNTVTGGVLECVDGQTNKKITK